MSIHATRSKIDDLNLAGLTTALQHQLERPALTGLPFEERLGMQRDAACMYRESACCDRLLRAAGLRVVAQSEEVTFDATRNLDKAMVLRLRNGDWIRRNHSVLITGKSGTGKIWLGCCLGTQAARLGLSVIYRRVSRVLEGYDVARHDGSLPRLRAKFARAKLLILEDFGLSSLKPTARTDLLEILDDRVGLSATIVCGQMPVANWHDYIGDAAIADAVLDPPTAAAHRIELDGPSRRSKGVGEEMAVEAAASVGFSRGAWRFEA